MRNRHLIFILGLGTKDYYGHFKAARDSGVRSAAPPVSLAAPMISSRKTSRQRSSPLQHSENHVALTSFSLYASADSSSTPSHREYQYLSAISAK